jgi:hypothetical protein
MTKVAGFLFVFTSRGLPVDVLFNACEGSTLRKNLIHFSLPYQVKSMICYYLFLVFLAFRVKGPSALKLRIQKFLGFPNDLRHLRNLWTSLYPRASAPISSTDYADYN